MDRSDRITNYIVTIAIIALWVVKYIAWTTPNNVLQASSYSNLVANEFMWSFIIGIVFIFVVRKTKINYTNKYHYWFNLSNCIILALLPIVLIIALIVGVLSGNGP
jgi:hypothetical protein